MLSDVPAVRTLECPLSNLAKKSHSALDSSMQTNDFTLSLIGAEYTEKDTHSEFDTEF